MTIPNRTKGFTPTTKKEWRQISKRARKRERLKTKVKADPKEALRRSRKEKRLIWRAQRKRFRKIDTIINAHAVLRVLAKRKRSKTVAANAKKFLTLFFQMLSEIESVDKAKLDPKKERHWPLLMPRHKDVAEGAFKRNECFIYDVLSLQVHLTFDQKKRLLALGMGKCINLPNQETDYFYRQVWDSVLNVYDVGLETKLDKKKITEEDLCSYGLRDPVATRKLWSRLKKRFFTVGKKSKWVDKGEDSTVKKTKVVDRPADAEKSAKKKLKGKKNRELDLGSAIKADKALGKKLKKKNRDRDLDKAVAKTKEKPTRTRLPNLTDESELRRVKGAEVNYRDSGALGKLWAIVPKSYIALSKFAKLAKKEGVEEVLLRQYLSLYRKAGQVEIRQ